MTKPFTFSDARASGMSRRQLEKCTQVFRGVYLPAGADLSLRNHVAAARLALPPGGHPTAITALRLQSFRVGDDHPLWFASPRRARVNGIRVVRAELEATATPGQAFGHLVPRSSLVEAVVVGDQLLCSGRVRPVALARHLPAAHRRVVALLDPGSQSPAETRLRLMVTLAGLPQPTSQLVVLRADGVPVGHADLGYEEFRVALEYEGRHHVGKEGQWSYDIRRYEEFARAGWTVIRVTLDHLHKPVDVVERVHRALVANGYRGRGPRFDGALRATFQP